MGFGFSPFTQFHVAISLVGIVAGFAVAAGLLTGRRLPVTTAVFLVTTAATSVTGFFFPIQRFTPGLAVGGLSLAVLALAAYARYARAATGGWRRVYAGAALAAQYLNVFVLVAQSFQKVPALNATAPTQTEPPFAVAQGVVLLGFAAVASVALRRPPAAHYLAAEDTHTKPGTRGEPSPGRPDDLVSVTSHGA
jgi:hypothetical protein